MKRIHLYLLPVLVTVLMVFGAVTAHAHAVLVSSSPAENESLAASPSKVETYFSEALDPSFSRLMVMDASGNQVDAGDSQVDQAEPRHLVANLTQLKDGVYTVMWTAVSAVDGHQSTGSYPFAVGKSAPVSMMATQTTMGGGKLDSSLVAAKLLLYLPAAILIGAIMFTLLVWRPSLRQMNFGPGVLPGYKRSSRKLLVAALVVLALADILSLLFQAGQVSGRWIGWPWQPDFVKVLFYTRFGALVTARLGIILILAGLLLTQSGRWNRYLALVVSMLLLLSFSFASHAAAEPLPVLPMIADLVHLIAISVWVGGLISFVVAVWSISKIAPAMSTKLASHMLPHFTVLAMSSVIFLGLTGIYATYLRVGPLSSLISTTYGKVLLVKHLIIAPMLALGGFHLLITTPLMKRASNKPNGDNRLVTFFRRLLTLEMSLGLLVVMVVSALTTLPPVRVSATLAGYNKITKVDDLRVHLNIDPGHAGMNTFTAMIASNGKPVVDAKDVSLEFRSMSGMMAPSKASLTKQQDGIYTLHGGYLSMADQWNVKVVVQRPGKFDAYASFDVPVSEAVARPIPWQSVTIGLLVASVLSLVFFASMMFRNRIDQWSLI